ncbi:MAG: thiamine pyrophosphate-binding protein [Acidimicrobiia bacterium]|nr:thiamine pyrophosphate-binding protein [Acidimicrobiia bacterium]
MTEPTIDTSDPSVAQHVVSALRACGIDTLYCVPGVQNDDFFDALVDAPDIRPVVARHEQGAAYMAMGAAQVTGDPAAFCVVPGPGMLNASAALTSAYWAYARVLAIVGQIATTHQGRHFGALHDLPDQHIILRQLTKESVEVHDEQTATATIQRAIDSVVSGMPRPVSIEVPADVWGRPAPGAVASATASRPALDPNDVERAAASLAGAKRPIIVVGSGASEAGPEVTALAERLGAAVTTRRMGHGVVPTSHPLFVPISVAHELWADADVVLGIGTRLEWPLGTWGVDDDLTLIQINLDADELDRHGVTDIALHADAADAAQALVDALGSGPPLDRAHELDGLRSRFAERTAHLTPQRSYTAAIRTALPDDAVLVEDVTQIGFAAHLFYDHLAPRSFLSSGAAGTLGAGAAVAIGASNATDRPVVGIVGDGGFLFTATELATAVQHDIACNILLFNDGAFGNVRRIQRTRFGDDRTIASKLENPDFATLADSFGVTYERADSPEALVPALRRSIENDGPNLIEVPVGEMPDPWPHLRLPAVRGPHKPAR